MAWRSWNAFLANIDDGLIRQNIQALVAKTSSAGPSLWEAGYKSIGIDEGEGGRSFVALAAGADELTPCGCRMGGVRPGRARNTARCTG